MGIEIECCRPLDLSVTEIDAAPRLPDQKQNNRKERSKLVIRLFVSRQPRSVERACLGWNELWSVTDGKSKSSAGW